MSVTAALIAVSIFVSVCSAHIELAPNSCNSNDVCYTVIRVPHGCLITGDDEDIDIVGTSAATSAITVTLPPDITEFAAGPVPFWTLTTTADRTNGSAVAVNNTVITWTAQPGYELRPLRLQLFPLFLTINDYQDTISLYFKTVQLCLGNRTVNWTADYAGVDGGPGQPDHPTPRLDIIGDTEIANAGSPNTFISMTTDSMRNEALSVCALVIAGVVLIGLLTGLTYRLYRPVVAVHKSSSIRMENSESRLDNDAVGEPAFAGKNV